MTVAGQSSAEMFDVCVVNIFQQHLCQPAQKFLTVPVLFFLYQGALEWTDGQSPGCILKLVHVATESKTENAGSCDNSPCCHIVEFPYSIDVATFVSTDFVLMEKNCECFRVIIWRTATQTKHFCCKKVNTVSSLGQFFTTFIIHYMKFPGRRCVLLDAWTNGST